jgi:hypothetical protein
MRLALIVALASDRRSGRVLSDILPADQAVTEVKQAIGRNEVLPDYPILAAVALDSTLREHRFKADAKPLQLGPEQQEQPGAPLVDVELGEGEDKVVIRVGSEEEADLVRNLAAGCKKATTLQLELDDLKATAAKASKPAK